MNDKINLIEYDFSNDCKCEKYKNEDNIIKRYFIYKAVVSWGDNFQVKSGEVIFKKGKKIFDEYRKNYKGIVDPDSNSEKLQDIYKKIWDYKFKKDAYMFNDKTKIYGDTMNSFSYVLNKVSGYSIRGSFEYSENIIENNKLNDDDDLDKELKIFLANYHKLGNFVPVPAGFNKARSGYMAKDDNWFYTLSIIEQYYKTIFGSENSKILASLLHNELCDNTIKWLGRYEYFDNFVVQNHFEMYTEENDYDIKIKKGEQHYHTKQLEWNKNPNRRGEKGVQLEFLKEVNEAIENRTKNMVKELK